MEGAFTEHVRKTHKPGQTTEETALLLTTSSGGRCNAYASEWRR